MLRVVGLGRIGLMVDGNGGPRLVACTRCAQGPGREWKEGFGSGRKMVLGSSGVKDVRTANARPWSGQLFPRASYQRARVRPA